jgi:hypothetical protein
VVGSRPIKFVSGVRFLALSHSIWARHYFAPPRNFTGKFHGGGSNFTCEISGGGGRNNGELKFTGTNLLRTSELP